jgi:CheY-like chemotaxis protein
VVEDEAAVLEMMEVALRHYGFDVKLAASGQEAIDLYQRHHQTIALVLLDVQMPDLDGPDTLAAHGEGRYRTFRPIPLDGISALLRRLRADFPAIDRLVLQRYFSSGVRCWREIRAARLRCW